MKSVSPFTMPGGSWTYWAGLVPFSRRALPNLPGTRGRSPGATHMAGVAGSMNARFRISSAYRPPTPAKLISSKNAPNRSGLTACPGWVVSTVSVSGAAAPRAGDAAMPSAADTVAAPRIPSAVPRSTVRRVTALSFTGHLPCLTQG